MAFPFGKLTIFCLQGFHVWNIFWAWWMFPYWAMAMDIVIGCKHSVNGWNNSRSIGMGTKNMEKCLRVVYPPLEEHQDDLYTLRWFLRWPSLSSYWAVGYTQQIPSGKQTQLHVGCQRICNRSCTWEKNYEESVDYEAQICIGVFACIQIMCMHAIK